MLLRRTGPGRADVKPVASKGAPRPSARIPVAISVTISGKDAAGNSFKEATRTVEIDRQGARILTLHELEPGSQLSVENPSLGQTALARVVECAPRRSRQEPFRVEVALVELPELFETASIWGVKGRGKEEGALGTAGSEAGAPAAPPQQVDVAPDGSLGAPQPSGPPAPVSSGRTAVETPAPRAPVASTAAADAIRAVADEAVAGLQKTRLEMQGSLESRAAQHQRQLAEMVESSLRELERKSDLIGRASLGQLESGLEASSRQAREEFTARLEDAAQTREARSKENLAGQAASAAASIERLAAEVKSSAAAEFSEMERRLAAAGQAAVEARIAEAEARGRQTSDRLLEAFEQRAGAVVGKAQAEAERLAREAEAAAERSKGLGLELARAQEQRISAAAESAALALGAASESALAELAESRQAAEASLRAAAGGLLSELTQAQQAAEAGLGKSSGKALAELGESRHQAESSLAAKTQEAEARLSALAAGRLEEIDRRSATWLARSASGEDSPGAAGSGARSPVLVKEEAEQAAGSLRGLARELAQDLEERAARQIEARSRAAAAGAEEELRRRARDLAEEAGRGLEQSGTKAIEAFELQAESLGEESRRAVAQTLEAQLAAATRDAEARLHPLLETVEGASAGLLRARREAEAATAAMNAAAEAAAGSLESVSRRAQASLAELENAAEQTRAGSIDRLAKQATDLERQTAESLRSASRALTEETRKQAADLTSSALESLGQRLGSASDEGLARLRAVLDEFAARSAEQVRALGDQKLENQYEKAKRDKAVLEQLRVDFARTERQAMRKMAGLARSLSASALDGLGFSLRLGLKAGFGLAALAAVAVTCLSIRPVMRLQSDPPREFYDEYLELGAPRSRGDALALGYWECARARIQNEYAFGKDLPETPPPDFRLEENIFPSGARVDPASRIRYWARLRLVWLLSSTWQKSYEWHTDWMRNALSRPTVKAPAAR